MDFTITVQRADEAAASLKQLAAKMDAISADAIERGLEKLLITLEGEVKQRSARDLGPLEASVFSEIRTQGSAIEGIVSTPLIYGPAIEFGRKPGKMPPLGPLKAWAARKLGDEKLAFPVAKSIAKNGFKSLQHGDKQGMFEDAFKENLGLIERSLNEIGVHVTQELLAAL